ncbi:unnamed protein product [Penicillium salamii]|uniref:Uncharacterized protein n=1 Tax=Penicillium salamii TaxID=1612424 RepID=A0A9W4IH97_9EURO|nr:unnamed protein product [Penicillium salamii]CAG8251315.1 unnamed protein product [Penicillium salamii]CAG8283991.1 unnamed protein product [Penicillium salamii]CAG8385334.1 unnamed protein product [Penicillium salamii]CAG8390637.1 unnamed protein product [Penicillium salamii]
MPGVGAMGSSEDSHALDRPLLRSHKTFPRRDVIIPSIEIVQPVSPDQNGKLTATPAPPLTPPDAGQETAIDERTPKKMASSVSDLLTTGTLTPRRTSKPPTPDVTPPRTNNSTKRPALNNLVHLSSSSRAESFQTALESISSEEDMETPGRMSQATIETPRQRNQQSKPPTSSGCLSHTADTRLSLNSSSRQASETEYETGFESFDGDWAANMTDGSPTPLAGKRKYVRNHTKADRPSTAARDTLDIKHLDASLMREKTLRERINGAPEMRPSPSMEQFRENIGWPSSERRAKANEIEARPISVISSTSTVEAMIIDSPKRAQRMLRHSGKRSSLRSASSPITASERTSSTSLSESQHRLTHKATRISPRDHRSVSSDVSFSAKASSSATQPKIETINVVVIPERNSSLKSTANSYASSKPSSQRSSRRPPTTSTGRTDIAQRERQHGSETLSIQSREVDDRSRSLQRPFIPPRSSSLSAPTSRDNSRAASLASNSLRSRPVERPIIPARSSSLSAPTSRNNSRATSLTSDSLRSHNLAMDLELHKRREHQPKSPPRHNVLASPEPPILPQVPHIPGLFSSPEDMELLQPPAMPFTQGSIPSSSPGPIEIQEATAVSLFAHNNHSLLLVDPRVRASSRPLQALGISHDNVRPHTPDNVVQREALFVDSPLKNPRPPPKPPVSKPLPPLPTKDQGPANDNDEIKGPTRRWSSVRRSWSARPRSDSFNTLTRSFSMKSAKNRTTGMEMDSRLHPFWRPRGFWEDVPSSPEKQLSPAHPLPSTPDESLVVNNSLGLPQRRIILDGPPSLARRSPELKRFFNGMTSNGSLVDQGIFRTGSPLHPARFQALSRWGRRIQAMSWRNMHNRVRRTRQRRDERKRAVRREALKRSIGPPIYVASSATVGVTTR